VVDPHSDLGVDLIWLVPDAGLTRLALADGTLTAAERDDPAAIASLLGTPEAVPEIRSYARASGVVIDRQTEYVCRVRPTRSEPRRPQLRARASRTGNHTVARSSASAASRGCPSVHDGPASTRSAGCFVDDSFSPDPPASRG
jgi:hypothetical protein